jgi:2-polyprenyl-3-methyl-5-hydroxy-6-metoxy-1,4-benzoquinol methylase
MKIKKTFVYKILSYSYIYDFLQWITGSYNFRKKIFLKIITNSNSKILDLGCGTANILKYIKIDHRNYYGFDCNQEYINKAKKNFPKANFSTKVIEDVDFNELYKIDYILLFGFVHHLNDSQVHELFQKIKSKINLHCKIITIDPAFVDNKKCIAKFIAKYDRGEFVRYEYQYKIIFEKYFKIENSYIETTVWPPANWFISILKPIL